MAKKKPVGIIVRRGAERRFEALKRKTADLPVVVTWDRRKGDRRASSEPAPTERRANDRRKAPPFTWETADFVVVEPPDDVVVEAAEDDDAVTVAASTPVDAKAKAKPRK